MTLDQFIKRLRALLTEAESAGLDPDQLCEVAEYTLQESWSDDD